MQNKLRCSRVIILRDNLLCWSGERIKNWLDWLLFSLLSAEPEPLPLEWILSLLMNLFHTFIITPVCLQPAAFTLNCEVLRRPLHFLSNEHSYYTNLQTFTDSIGWCRTFCQVLRKHESDSIYPWWVYHSEEVVEITVLPMQVLVMMEEDALYKGRRGSWDILREDSQLVKINVKVNCRL